jgi:GT2 family glycosyltransferase
MNNFSVLTSVYANDNPDLFNLSLNSIFLNTCVPDEVVIVVDGPINEKLEDVLNKFNARYKQIKIKKLDKNIGLALALNYGLRFISNEFIIRSDADDFSNTNRFEELIKALEAGYDIVGSKIQEIDIDGNNIAIRDVPVESKDIKKYIKFRSPFNHMSVAYKKSIIIKAGGYPNIYLKEDYALWAKLISMDVKAMNIDKILVNATAGIEMFKRRGGFKYAIAEIELQKHLVSLKLKSPLEGCIHFFIRFVVFILPSSARAYIYLNFLRK